MTDIPKESITMRMIEQNGELTKAVAGVEVHLRNLADGDRVQRDGQQRLIALFETQIALQEKQTVCLERLARRLPSDRPPPVDPGVPVVVGDPQDADPMRGGSKWARIGAAIGAIIASAIGAWQMLHGGAP